MKVYITRIKNGDRKTLSSQILKYSYRDTYGRNINIAKIHKGEYGKPYYDNNFYYNISHSKNFLCIATDENEIGIDIEESRSVNSNLSKRILAKDEDVIDEDILNNWVIKEAYSKYLGLGLNVDFRDISTSDIMGHENVTNLSTNDYVCFVVSKKPSDIKVTCLKEEDLVKAGC